MNVITNENYDQFYKSISNNYFVLIFARKECLLPRNNLRNI